MSLTFKSVLKKVKRREKRYLLPNDTRATPKANVKNGQAALVDSANSMKSTGLNLRVALETLKVLFMGFL